MRHIFPKNDGLDKKEVDNFINLKNTLDKISRIKRKYSFSKNILEIQEPSEIFKFDIKDHGKNLLDELMKNDIFLNSTWEYNNLDSFQDHLQTSAY